MNFFFCYSEEFESFLISIFVKFFFFDFFCCFWNLYERGGGRRIVVVVAAVERNLIFFFGATCLLWCAVRDPIFLKICSHRRLRRFRRGSVVLRLRFLRRDPLRLRRRSIISYRCFLIWTNRFPSSSFF